MPCCLLMMKFQSICISGEDRAMIQTRVDRVLRARLLPATESAQPLEI